MRIDLFALVVLTFCGALLGGGCATQQAPEPPFAYPPELIDGAAVFGETVTPAPALDLLWVSPAMAEFVDPQIKKPQFGYSRFRRLMGKMVRSGFFLDQYERTATYSAARTFEEHKGNCLAYTNLFVALARQAGLEAKYQLVNTRPTWDVESGFLVRNKHVNVVLERIQVPGKADGSLTVDFNNVEVDQDTPRHTISDAYAESLFYANIAIENLHAKRYEATFAYLKRSILTEPRNIDSWINIGVLYSIFGKFKLAQAAYETALRNDAGDKTALSGLAKSYRQQGNNAQAEVYEQLVKHYQRKNPYYHYALAEQAFRNASFEEALASVNQAIQLKRNNARFYGLRAATAQELGDPELAEKSFRLQRKHGGGEQPYLKPSGAAFN